MRIYERFGGISLLAGFGCYFLAFTLIIFAPAVLTNAGEKMVQDVVTGEWVDVPPYTADELAGKDLYIKQVCWHCHSQFIRPINEENRRWGPVSQPGESTIDQPMLFGTRRIGPDLSREGGRRPDDWHYAHFYDPRYTVQASVMQSYPFLFRKFAAEAEINEWIDKLDTDRDGLVSGFDEKVYWPEGAAAAITSPALDNAGMFNPAETQKMSLEYLKTYEDKYTGIITGDGLLSNYDSRPRPNEDLQNLVKYLQRKGTEIGKWRTWPQMGTPSRTYAPAMRGVDDVFIGNYPAYDDDGKVVTDEDGKVVLEPWTTGIRDGKMPLRGVEMRLFGVAADKAGKERKAAALDAKLEYDAVMRAWRKENPEWDERLNRGKDLYQLHCAGCHGDEGRGNGPASAWLMVRPRDFTKATYRYRSTQVGTMPLDGDIYRTLFRGLPGSAMPHWSHLPDEHLWLLVDYVKHFQESKYNPNSYQREAKPWNKMSARIAIPPMPPLMPSEYKEMELRGRAVYAAMKCINCHGTTGRADGPKWFVNRSNGGVIRARDFAKRDEKDRAEHRMRGGASPRDLYRTLMTGLDGTGMPAVYSEFVRGFEGAEKVAELEAKSAPEAEIEAARQRAKIDFFVSLGEDLPGVYRAPREGQDPLEYIVLRPTKQDPGTGVATSFGDDWAIVWYLMRTMNPDVVWPYTIPDEDDE